MISYIFRPDGSKFRTKAQMARFLGESVDLTSFDYRTGEINSLLLRKGKRQKNSSLENIRGFRCGESSMVPPIRRTASIFKQPVTLVRSINEGTTRSDPLNDVSSKPKQIFWEKRLENMRASNKDQEFYESFELPKRMRAVGPNVTSDTAIRSILSALHLHTQAVTGQTAPKSDLEKNCSLFVNTEQPLVEQLDITDEDLRKQEESVNLARKRLEKFMNELDDEDVNT